MIQDRQKWAGSAAVCLALLLASLLMLQFFTRLDHDVGWYLYAAQYYVGRCQPYVDCFFDPNPPFILWFSTLGVWIGRLPGLTAIEGMRVLVVATTVANAWLSWRVARGRFGVTGPFCIATILTPLVFINVTQFPAFGQRDFLAAICLFPHVLLVASRQDPIPVRVADAVVIGMLAALGICLKPHTILVLASVEIGFLRSTLRATRPRLPELASFVAVLGLAGLALLVLTPGYFDFLAQVSAFYPYLGNSPLHTALVTTWHLLRLGIVVAAAIPALRLADPSHPVLKALFLATIGAALSYALQRKGFAYHHGPLDLFACALGLWSAAVLRRHWPLRNALGRTRTGAAVLSSVALLSLAAYAGEGIASGASILVRRDEVPGRDGRSANVATDDELRSIIATFDDRTSIGQLAPLLRRAGGRGVMMLATDIPPLFPAVTYAGMEYAGRFQDLWFLPGILHGAAHMPPERYAAGRAHFYGLLAADFASSRPRVLIAREGRQIGIGDSSFSIMRYLAADPQFASILAEYGCVKCAPSGDRDDIYLRKNSASQRGAKPINP